MGPKRVLRRRFVQRWPTPNARDVLGVEQVIDATTLLKLRLLIQADRLRDALYAEVGKALYAGDKHVGDGTIVATTFITAPSSTNISLGLQTWRLTIGWRCSA